MHTFWQWLLGDPLLPFTEGDEGRQAFVDSQNRSFQAFLRQLLAARKISDPRLVQEAEVLLADPSLFDYGEELLKLAARGRGRLAGGDTLQAATEVAGRMWETLWRPQAYPGTESWETRFPHSADRGGLRGTVRAYANHLLGHYAQRLRKSRAHFPTLQWSQIDDAPLDPVAPAADPEGEWGEWRAAILAELIHDLRRAEASNSGGKHGQARIRNLRWAVIIAEKQLAIPYRWRSMSEVLQEIPELRGIRRGGLQQTLKALIDAARMRAVAKIGTAKEQGVAHWLQSRRQGRRRARVEESFWPMARTFRQFLAPAGRPCPGGAGGRP
jgi:hypothetical protein